MYHLLETEFDTLTGLNALALIFFSLGSFVASALINILVSYAFSSSKLSPIADMLLHVGVVCLGVFGLMLFGAGAYCVGKKNTTAKKIKAETKVSERVSASEAH